MTETYLVVGLGNPGISYQHNRHNIGFLVLEAMAKQHQVAFSPCSFKKSISSDITIAGKSIKLLKPMTYMNHSGEALKELLSRESLPLEHILVICDDINLPFAQTRIKAKGSAGGNNGLKSIIRSLGHDEFVRLRLGVGSPPAGVDCADYVLSDFLKEERNHLENFIDEAIKCVSLWADQGIGAAMENFNRQKNPVDDH